MKRLAQLLNLFVFITLLTLASCGNGDSLGKIGSSSNSLDSGAKCGCDTSYFPVCGSNGVTYDNICIASCYKVARTVQGNCICSGRYVCADDGRSYTECDAQAAIRNGYIRKIVQYAPCDASTL